VASSADVKRAGDVEPAVAETAAAFGRVDLLAAMLGGRDESRQQGLVPAYSRTAPGTAGLDEDHLIVSPLVSAMPVS